MPIRPILSRRLSLVNRTCVLRVCSSIPFLPGPCAGEHHLFADIDSGGALKHVLKTELDLPRIVCLTGYFPKTPAAKPCSRRPKHNAVKGIEKLRSEL